MHSHLRHSALLGGVGSRQDSYLSLFASVDSIQLSEMLLWKQETATPPHPLCISIHVDLVSAASLSAPYIILSPHFHLILLSFPPPFFPPFFSLAFPHPFLYCSPDVFLFSSSSYLLNSLCSNTLINECLPTNTFKTSLPNQGQVQIAVYSLNLKRELYVSVRLEDLSDQ